MVNPLAWRTTVLPKHAQHVVLIHFPIALFVSGVVFDLLGRGRRLSQLAGAAYLNFSAAAVMVFPSIATGLFAWQLVFEGKRLRGLLLLHLIAASCAGLLIIASWWVHRRARKTGASLLPGYRIAVELLGVAVLALTAHLGGFLSGINS